MAIIKINLSNQKNLNFLFKFVKIMKIYYLYALFLEVIRLKSTEVNLNEDSESKCSEEKGPLEIIIETNKIYPRLNFTVSNIIL